MLLTLARTITPLMGLTAMYPFPTNSIHAPEYLEPSHYFEPVIFEPCTIIKLSRSTYKVTSFTNFPPYLASFSNLYAYLPQLKAYLSRPEILGPLRTWGGEKAMPDS